MRKSILIIALLVINVLFGQNLNQYKYVQVPTKFSFQQEKDQYRLNNLAKAFMKQYGFDAYFDTDNLPNVFLTTNCNKIFLDVISNSGVFTTKLLVVLKDCKGTVLYTSKEGSSRDKEYAIAYNQSLRMAFESMKNLNYRYTETTAAETVTTVTEKVEGLKIISDEKYLPLLLAKPTENGFQLLKAESELMFTILRTSNQNIFLATKNKVQGVIYKEKNQWFFEYYKDGILNQEALAIDFDGLK
jgi:hypothetical protein